MVFLAGDKELKVQRGITAAIAAGADLDNVLARITRTAARLCQSDMAAIALLMDRDDLEVVSVFGTPAPALGARLPVAGRLEGLVVISGQSARRTDALRAPGPLARWIPSIIGARGILMVPLRDPQGPFGTLGVAKRRPWHFTDRSEALLSQLADSASIAIQNAQLREHWEGAAPPAASALLARRRPLRVRQSRDGRRTVTLAHARVALSLREREILHLLIGGKTCKEIASALGISSRTVEHHVEHLKLRCHQPRLHGLVGFAISHRL